MKFREATEADADGGGFPFALIGKPPRPRYKWRLRDIPLIARPPLLAVMQGGECACSKLIHTPPPVRLDTLSIHPLQSAKRTHHPPINLWIVAHLKGVLAHAHEVPFMIKGLGTQILFPNA